MRSNPADYFNVGVTTPTLISSLPKGGGLGKGFDNSIVHFFFFISMKKKGIKTLTPTPSPFKMARENIYKRKTRMTKWNESSGASPPQPPFPNLCSPHPPLGE